MATLKSILNQQVSIPRNIEASLPAGAPSISSILADIANALPDTPGLPISNPGGLTAGKFPQVVPDLIKGIEDALPDIVPKFSGVLGPLPGQASYREIEITEEKAGAVKTPYGGGYRSIT